MGIPEKWLVTLGSFLALSASANPIMAFTFSLFIPPLTAEFGWSRAFVAGGFTAAATAQCLTAPISGWAIDRFGARRTLLVGILCYGLALASVSLTTNAVMFLACYALLGTFANMQSAPAHIKVLSEWFDANRGLAIGVAVAGMSLGALLLPRFVQGVLLQADWRTAYVALAALVTAIAFTAVFILVRELHAPPRTTMATAGAGSQGAGFVGVTPGAALRDWRFWAIACWTTFISMGLNGGAAHAIPLLTSHGIAMNDAIAMLAALAVGSLLGRLGSGLLMDRFHAPVIAALISFGAAVGVMLLWGRAPGAAAYIAIILFGFGVGAEIDVLGYLIGRYFGLRHFGQVFAYAFIAVLAPAAIGAVLMGVSFDRTGSYDTALLGFAAGLVVATGCVLALGGYRFPPRPVGGVE